MIFINKFGLIFLQEKKLANVKLEEEKVRNMQANNAKNRKTSTASNGSGSIPKNNGGAKVRHGSGGATAQGMADLQDRFQIVLWRRPLQTIHYFFREIPCAVNDAGKRYEVKFGVGFMSNFV